LDGSVLILFYLLLVGWAVGAPPTFGGPRGAAAQIYRSRNGGESWQTLNGGLPETFHGMVRGLVVDPSNDAALYAGTTDGDLYYSEDEGDNWSLVMEGLPQVWVIKPSSRQRPERNPYRAATPANASTSSARAKPCRGTCTERYSW